MSASPGATPSASRRWRDAAAAAIPPGEPTVDERFTLSMVGDKLMFHWGNGGYGVKITAK
jgi:hypothetical protein